MTEQTDIREFLHRMADETGFAPVEPRPVVRKARRRLVLTVAGTLFTVGALVAGALVGADRLMTPHSTQRPAAVPAERASEPVPAERGPFFLDLQTGEKTPLAQSLFGGESYVASPDGTTLAYGTCCSAADVTTVANVDGTERRTLEAPEGLNTYGTRWSPDGTKVVYQARDGGDDTALTGDVGNLFVEDLASGELTQLTELELTRAWWWFLAPSFTPDGRNVVFHLPRSRSETTKWDVWSVRVTGGEPALVLRNATFPMVGADLPNEVSIAFVSPWPDDFAGRGIVAARLLSPPDSDLRQTLVEANDSIVWPSMSPDGSRIAYQDGGSIYVIDYSSLVGLEPSKVADGNTAEWIDDDTLIVAPS